MNIKSGLYLFVLSVLLVSCGTAPAPVEELPPIQVIVPEEDPVEPVEEYTQELYDETLSQVRAFIEGLNQIIQNRNFDEWRSVVSEERYAIITSREFLETQSAMPALRGRNIVLRTVNDYFTHVVVPSRASSRVDDIDFITEDHVRAFFIDNNDRRLELYELIKIDNQWKILN